MLGFLPSTLEGWALLLTGLVTVASVITSLTPTPKDDAAFAKVYKLIEMVGLNIGKAKQTGAMLLMAGFASVLLTGCAGYTPGGSAFIDHDGDPATPPMEMTLEQRCAWYDMRIGMIDAKPEQSGYDAAARTGYSMARSTAGCPPLPQEP